MKSRAEQIKEAALAFIAETKNVPKNTEDSIKRCMCESYSQQLTKAHEALAIAREALEMKHDEALITQKALAAINEVLK